MIDQGVEKKENIGTTVTRGVTVYGAGNISLLFVDFIKSVLLLRWLLIVEYGLYRLILAGCDFFSALFLGGLNNVVIAEVSRDLKENKRLGKAIYSIFVYFLIVIGIGLWALFFWGGSLLTFWFPYGGQFVRLISFIFLLWPLDTIFQITFSIFLDFKWTALFKMLRNTSHLIVLILFFTLNSFSLREAFLSLMIGTIVPIFISLVGYRRERLLIIPSRPEFKSALNILLLNFGKWALLDDLAMNAGKNIQPFIIKFLAGTEAVALFAFAQNLVAYATALFPIREVLTPVFPRVADQPEQMVSKINRATKYATLVYVLIAIAAAFGAPVLAYFFFPKYVPALPLFYILLLALPWLGFRSVALPVLYALRAQKVVFILTIVRFLLITALGIVLIYFFGVWGAAIESVLVGILLTPTFAKALHRVLPQWQFSLTNLVSVDDYDKKFLFTFINQILNKIKIKI